VTVDSGFCPRCGTALPGRPPISCVACGYQLFVNARPTSTVIIVEDSTYLVTLRAIEPRKGLWDLPGGFCDGFEHPADAAVREAREELGVTVHLGQFVGMYVGSYEFQNEMVPVLDCFWFATIVAGEITLAADEVSDYAWLPLADPPDLAFDTMNRAILDARILHAGDLDRRLV
jgi:8-oxo-dGTP diphosphatase